MVAGADDGELQGGGRSSGVLGIGVVVHGETNGWARSAPGSSASAMTCSGASWACSSHGDDFAGGGKLTATAERDATVSYMPRG